MKFKISSGNSLEVRDLEDEVEGFKLRLQKLEDINDIIIKLKIKRFLLKNQSHQLRNTMNNKKMFKITRV